MIKTTWPEKAKTVKKNKTMSAEKEKNFGLNQEQFQELVRQLQNGDERLLEQIFLKHFREAIGLVRKKYRATPEEAYDAVMEALLRFRQKIIQEKVYYGNLRLLFFQMCSQHHLKWLEKQQRMRRYKDQKMKTLSEKNEDDTMFVLLDKAMSQLGEECKNLLKKFYYNGITLRHLSRENNRPETAVRKQKQRCMNRLKLLFFKFTHQHSL